MLQQKCYRQDISRLQFQFVSVFNVWGYLQTNIVKGYRVCLDRTYFAETENLLLKTL